ncbi:MAG: 8-amino-7-oxononanoate synthase [Thermodesulfovibrio sp.]|nr:8-amino-7-oxononanoate synthase [Thermodesulfovibrio sp.]
MSEKIFEIFEKKLEKLRQTHLYRSVKDTESREGMKITINGQKFINFASNDYLGLSQHPFLKKAAIEAIKIFGIGGGASRLLSGGVMLHKKLEELLCRFKNSQSSLVLNSGYTANISLIPVLAQENDIIFSDELNHASIIDGCRLSRAQKIIYRHADLEDLQKLIKNSACRGNKIIVTDTVFSMDGDIAPVKELYEICKREGALLYLDDAHGTGVLGNGFGALKHFDLNPEEFIIQMGTFSKAIGSFGAFVCGSSTLIDWFINSARGFIFSTALPASIIASSYASLKIIMEDNTLIEKLWQNTVKLREIINNLGLKTTNTQTPIIPILFEDIESAIKASEVLQYFNIYAPVIRPPTVKIPRIRLTITASHSLEDIERLEEALKKL